MRPFLQRWLPQLVTLAAFGVAAWLAPIRPVDPWGALSPHKIALLLFALVLMQVIGGIAAASMEDRLGATFTGFLGGMVSSTAVTAHLSKQSQTLGDDAWQVTALGFLGASLAKLGLIAMLVYAGAETTPWPVWIVIVAPALATAGLLFARGKKLEVSANANRDGTPELALADILKLGGFVVGLIALSKILQSLFGDAGLLAVTALFSLFEVHASTVANAGLFDTGSIAPLTWLNLLAVSIAASYISKAFLVASLAKPGRRRRLLSWISIILLALLLGYVGARALLAMN